MDWIRRIIRYYCCICSEAGNIIRKSPLNLFNLSAIKLYMPHLKSYPKYQQFIIRKRWFIVGSIIVLLLIFEFSEHGELGIFSRAFYYESGVFALFAFIVGILLELTWRAERGRREALDILVFKQAVGHRLSASKEIADLVEDIRSILSMIISLVGMNIRIRDSQDGEFYSIAKSAGDSFVEMTNEICPECLAEHLENRVILTACNENHGWRNPDLVLYSLALAYGDQWVGVILLGLPSGKTITDKQIRLLENISDEIALAILTSIQRRERRQTEIAKAATTERLMIARDLHDTLGQNLGYMHFKLDQILMNKVPEELDPVFEDLVQLRRLADESYELVRNTLVILHRQDQLSVKDLLHSQAQLIADRAGFALEIEESGEPITLPPRHLNEISFVIKETMRNIEVHARAKTVKVRLAWQPGTLEIVISDDGVGFDPSSDTPDGHYGLKILRDRVTALDGQVGLNSVINQGTQINILVPIGGKDLG